MKILLVDDEPYMRVVLQDCLKSGGFDDLHTAISAEQAFQALGIEDGKLVRDPLEVDCILLDIAMPDIDGIEVCKCIKSIEAYRYVPILMVTAMDDEKLLKVALEAGAADYIRKPFNEIELIARIKTMMKIKNELQGLHTREQNFSEQARELRTSNLELSKLVQVDEVTGLITRQRFDEQFIVEWKRAKRNKLPLSLILIDIDHFNSYNDAYGKSAGDDCLKTVARTLKNRLRRPSDLLGRSLRDEFAVVLPDTATKGAMKVAETLKTSIREMKIKHEKSLTSDFLTISVGVTSYIPIDEMRPVIFMESAEKALLSAKDEGGNRAKSYIKK